MADQTRRPESDDQWLKALAGFGHNKNHQVFVQKWFRTAYISRQFRKVVDMTSNRVNPAIVGQVLSNGTGETITIVGETLAEALDIDSWDVVDDRIPKRTTTKQAQALKQTDELLKNVASKAIPVSRK